MKQDSVLTPPETGVGNSPEMQFPRCPKRLAGADRRTQVLGVATAQFAKTGLHGTTTQALAKAAGVSEPVLYAHFSSKECLFREAVENNIELRLRTLDDRLALIGRKSLIESIESMAEATVAVCVSAAAHAVLTNWALLEAPEYAAELYRNEIGSVGIKWERELARRFPDSRSRAILSIHLVPHAITGCLAYGFWLAMLRQTPESAAALAGQFATGVAQAASALLSRQSKQ